MPDAAGSAGRAGSASGGPGGPAAGGESGTPGDAGRRGVGNRDGGRGARARRARAVVAGGARVRGDCGLDVRAARVETLGAEVVDVFYVTDADGKPLVDEEVLGAGCAARSTRRC